jgi:hypothetical protein
MHKNRENKDSHTSAALPEQMLFRIFLKQRDSSQSARRGGYLLIRAHHSFVRILLYGHLG